MKLEKQYEENFVSPALEQKKNELDKIRNFYRPIKRKELDDHEKNFFKELKMKEDEKRFKREEMQKSMQPYDPSRFETKLLKEILEKEKEDKLKQEEDARFIRQKAEKMENYAKLVKTMHKPQISMKKRKEIQNLKKSIEVGNRPVKLISRKANVSVTDSELRSVKKHRQTRSQVKVDWKKFHNPMIPKEKVKKEVVVDDYLSKKRNKRWEKENDMRDLGENITNPYFDWKALIDKELPEQEYEFALKEKVRLIEANAHMKQKYARVKDDIDEEDEANHMMISAMEAKLAILERT